MPLEDKLQIDKRIQDSRELLDFATAMAEDAYRDGDEFHQAIVEIFFYTALVEHDTRVIARSLLDDEVNRIIWERYLALTLYAGVETSSRLVNKISRQIKSRPPTSRIGFDSDRYFIAMKDYKTALKGIKSPPKFWGLVTRTRNSVTAHHLTDTGSVSKVVDWISSLNQLQSEKKSAWDSPILLRSIQFSEATRSFSIEIGNCLIGANQDLLSNLDGYRPEQELTDFQAENRT